jgi:methionyl aminopeptidase
MLRFLVEPKPKTAREICLMCKASKVVAEAVSTAQAMAKPGVRTLEIDQAVEALYLRHKARPIFKGYPCPSATFPAATCLSVNEQVLNGIPGPRILRDGDLLKLSTACQLNGWCAMVATTVPIGTVSPEKRRLIQVAEEMLEIARVELARRTWWSEVAEHMQGHAEGAGYSIVKNYCGSGIGQGLKEPPLLPNFVSHTVHGVRENYFRLQPGLALAVSPLVNMGRPDVRVLSNGLTVITVDGLPSAHVQRTFVLTPNGVQDINSDYLQEVDTTCPTCHGTGRTKFFFRCESCNGSGERQ